jgi:hypothetical protein
LKLRLHANPLAVYFQQHGSLKQSYGENQAQRLLGPDHDPYHARQRAFFDPHFLTRLEKWKRLEWQMSIDGFL